MLLSMKTSHQGFIAPLILIIIALLVLGGGAYVYVQKKQANPPTTGNLPVATSTAQITSQISNLTLSDINNAIYTIIDAVDGGTKAQFFNGKFQPQENNALSNGGLNSIISAYTFGDINQDGRGDAVVITTSGKGARDARVNELQIVLNINGKPQAKNVAIPLRTGEQNQIVVGIGNISIDNSGIIILRIDLHSISDTNAYSSVPVIRKYRYDGNSLLDFGTN